MRSSETNAHCEQPVEGCEPAIIQEADFVEGIITVIFKVKGDGTNYLKSLKIGDTIDFLLAPLGNTFTLPEAGKKAFQRALLIGAGIGIAPMLYLKKLYSKKGLKHS